jgi:hypothetical protein
MVDPVPFMELIVHKGLPAFDVLLIGGQCGKINLSPFSVPINMVIAWRIMLMTSLGRECPELPADVLFSDMEIEVLRAHAAKKNSEPPTLLG